MMPFLHWVQSVAEIVVASGVICGVVATVYKTFIHKPMQSMREEQALICYGVMACLRGLQEQGCNGRVTTALGKMEKHLNLSAHDCGGEG